MASKYGNKQATYGGVTFDSKSEGKYYLGLLSQQQKGVIKEIEFQPTFVLQERFKKNGVTHQPITYKADFRVTYVDGRVEIIDVKGMKTDIFRIKHKLFEYKYPDLHLVIEKV